MVRDLCIRIFVLTHAADIVELVRYAVVEIPADAVDADHVVIRSVVDVCGGGVAVFIQDTMRPAHLLVMVSVPQKAGGI